MVCAGDVGVGGALAGEVVEMEDGVEIGEVFLFRVVIEELARGTGWQYTRFRDQQAFESKPLSFAIRAAVYHYEEI